MKFFVNLSTRAKLFFSFGLIWILLLVVIVIAYNGIKEITISEKDLHDIDFRIALDLRDLRSNQNFNRAAILDLMLSKSKADQQIIEKTILERSQLINDVIKDLLKLDSDLEFQNKLKELKDSINLYRQTREEEIRLIYEGKKDEAHQLGTSVQDKRFSKIRLLAMEMGDKASEDADKQLKLDQKHAESLTMIFIIVGIISLLLSFIMIFLMNRIIANPLKSISIIASRIATGDLVVVIPEDNRKDEVGLLNQAFRLMVENLRKSIKDLIEGINTLSSSSSEILASTTQVASGAAETATAISETTATVEEVRQAAQLSSQKANLVSENAQQVGVVTQTGQKAVEETVKVMNHIQNQMESIANTIVRLSEQSQLIGGIVASVTDVADQSNLLAVNAAIEAAKAGEQGKGFAVVAQEIKSLAEQSKQATLQVRNILMDVQKATSAAVMATEQGSKAVENGVKQSAQAGESIQLLSQSVSESIQVATQIVASSKQQAVGMDQIGIAISNINQAGAESAASMVQTERAARDLNELGQKLKLLVEQYKI